MRGNQNPALTEEDALQHICSHPGCTSLDIADSFGVTEVVARSKIKRLRDAGEIDIVRKGPAPSLHYIKGGAPNKGSSQEQGQQKAPGREPGAASTGQKPVIRKPAAVPQKAPAPAPVRPSDRAVLPRRDLLLRLLSWVSDEQADDILAEVAGTVVLERVAELRAKGYGGGWHCNELEESALLELLQGDLTAGNLEDSFVLLAMIIARRELLGHDAP